MAGNHVSPSSEKADRFRFAPFAEADAQTFHLILLTSDRVKAMSYHASDRSELIRFTKSGQVSVRTMSSNDLNLPIIRGVCQEF
jgi:hypothetical protein